MLIDDWDISEANARQRTVTPGFHALDNESEWARGSPSPAFMDSATGFKTIKVTVWVYGDGREEILNNCSEILSRLLQPVSLQLDGFTHRFYGILLKHSLDEKSLQRWHVLTLQFDGYEYDALEDGSAYEASARGSSITIENEGNLPTPCTVEITPQIGVASLTVTGLCRDTDGTDLPVTINTLTTAQTITLDGETGLVTETDTDGNVLLKAADVEIWALPMLQPGSNTLTLSDSQMSVTVKYYPRYM